MDSVEQEFMTVPEVKNLLRISRSAAYKIVGSEIPAYHFGRCVRVRSADLARWLEAKRDAPEETKHAVSVYPETETTSI
jgi:excisionase family DNA binding protein